MRKKSFALAKLNAPILTAAILIGGMLTAVGGFFPGDAQAQVATTDLTQGQALFIVTDTAGINNTSLTPHNPAAIQWAGVSKISAGTINGGTESTDPSGAQVKSHEGGFAGVLFAGENAAFSAATISVEDTGKGFTKSFESGHAQFSLNLGGTLAVGVGLEKVTVEDQFEVIPMVFSPIVIETELQSFGVALNFENKLFIGYAQGTRKLTAFLPEFSVTQDLGEGEFAKKGVALRIMGGWKWYLEHFSLDFQALENAPGSGIHTTTDALQVNIHGVLIGFSTTAVELEQDPAQPNVEQTVETNTLEVGWVPDQGVAFTLRVVSLKSEAFDPVVPANNFSETITTASFALSYLF